MRQFDTSLGTLPVATGAGSSNFGYRNSPTADFLSQLIAERHHLAPQRARRRVPIPDALDTYDAAGRLSVRRMPPGYRMNLEA